MRLVFLGPPGAGKGTIAKMLSRKHGIPHVSTGDILRAKIQNGSPLGQKAKSYVDEGKLVPDGLVIEIVMERLKEKDTEKGFILDGFPRTENQARALDEKFEGSSLNLNHAIFFAISEKTLIERLGGRRTCERCGEIYHLRHIPSQREEICDRCGGRLILRADDREEAVRERFRVYEKQTAPLVRYYREKSLLREVPAELGAAEVAGHVERFISPFEKGA